jgi:uncharacterized protein Yka (UPF0111/DUF47 family)
VKLLNFLPKEDGFYKLLEHLVQQSQVAAQTLHKALAANHSLAQEQAAHEAIHNARQEAKKTLRSLIEEVCRSFVTPFDREDLQELGTALYAICSCLDGVQQRLFAHGLPPLEGDFQRFSQIFVHQAEIMVGLIKGLNHGEKPSLLQEKVAALYELEDQGDNVLLELEAALFRKEPLPDVRDLLLRKDVYGQLEDITDSYRDAAAIALRIILKHS